MKQILFLFVIALFFLIGCTGNSTDNSRVGCTEDARLCPDGTSVVRILPNCEFEECPTLEKHFCTEEQRTADVCIGLFSPVCGWSDPEAVQCITYPCASTFSNNCVACTDDFVLYWTEGECPE